MLKDSPIYFSPLDQHNAYPMDVVNRGDYFSRDVLSQPIFRRQFNETGFCPIKFARRISEANRRMYATQSTGALRAPDAERWATDKEHDEYP